MIQVKGGRDGGTVVSDGSHVLADLDASGDEPLMLARALPGVRVLVCADRYLAGTLAERRLPPGQGVGQTVGADDRRGHQVMSASAIAHSSEHWKSGSRR